MKKLLLLLIIVILSIPLHAQPPEPILIDLTIIRITDIKDVYKNGKIDQERKARELEEINQVAVLDGEKKLFIIGNNNKSKYHIGEFIDKSVARDIDGDKYLGYKYNAVDEENIECTLIIRTWVDLTYIEFLVFYPNAIIHWSGNYRNKK